MFAIKRFILILIFISFIFGGIAYTNTLSFKLRSCIKFQNEKIGIAVIKDNNIWIINNRKQPLLSVFKYIAAVKVLNYLEKKQIPLDKKIIIKENMVDKNTYSPMLNKYLSFPFKISISELLMYMISESDNNACDILIDYSGGLKELESFIHNLGFEKIEISVNEKDMNNNVEKQYLNKSYPIDVARLMKYVHEGNLLSEYHSNFLDKLMKQTSTGKDKLKAGVPPSVSIYHKTGSGSRRADGTKIADNDAGYVFLPDGRIYYIVVMIEDSKLSDAENAKIISNISRVVYNHFTKK